MKIIIIIVSLFLINDAIALRNVRVLFPETVTEGDTATLYCLYDLQGEQLYSLKWYRGSYEFYRYHPREIPKVKLFLLPGLHVDRNESNYQRLTLLNVPLNLRGYFSCEVSTEAPLYTTKLVTHFLNVVPKSMSGAQLSKPVENYARTSETSDLKAQDEIVPSGNGARIHLPYLDFFLFLSCVLIIR